MPTSPTHRPGPGGPWAFDPVRVGTLEAGAWAAYYRREWRAFLVGAVGLTREAFALSWPRTVRGAWWVLRANQAWAPLPDNDPDAARALMHRFYDLVRRSHRLGLDPAEAARLEVDWWRAHREHQHGGAGEGDGALVGALQRLYAYVYATDEAAVRPAAALRARAMEASDAWVAAGCDPADPLLGQVRRDLVASYTALRAAVDPARASSG